MVVVSNDGDGQVYGTRFVVGAACYRVESRLQPVHPIDELLGGESYVAEVGESVDVVARPDVVLHRLGICSEFVPESFGGVAGGAYLGVSLGDVLIHSTTFPIHQERAVVRGYALSLYDANLDSACIRGQPRA